jgi:hypothetical protein
MALSRHDTAAAKSGNSPPHARANSILKDICRELIPALIDMGAFTAA